MRIKNYINKDIYSATGAILLVLILIFVSSRFVKYIQLAVDGTISADAVFELLALQIPSVAGFLIPLSFFLAILLTFGRLYSDNELVVIHGLGIGQRDLAKMLMPMALLFALMAGALSIFLTPWAVAQGKILLAEQASKANLGVFSAGRFRENNNKDGIVFVQTKLDDGTIKGVFSVSRPLNKSKSNDEIFGGDRASNDKEPRFLKIQTAKKGRHWEDKETGVSYLVLEEGQFSEYDVEQDSWQLTEFGSSYTRIVQDDSINVKNNTKSTATSELLRNLGDREWAAIHWRMMVPISIPLICLLAIPLSRTQPRKGKFSRLLPSILIYLIYVLLMMYSRKLIESGVIPGVLGFWWIHAAMAMFIYWMYWPTKKWSIGGKKV